MESKLQELRRKLDAGEFTAGSWAHKFASDIVRKANRGCNFSPKQLKWIHKLAAPTKPAETVENVNVRGIVALFNAAERLKYPKITLRTSDGLTVQFKRAGERSRYPGAINITDGGGYYDGTWYGRVNPDSGDWTMPRDKTVPLSVRELVEGLSEDPASVAGEYGKLTGNCCFCRRALTDDRSVGVGYGPICASTYGLPWGS